MKISLFLFPLRDLSHIPGAAYVGPHLLLEVHSAHKEPLLSQHPLTLRKQLSLLTTHVLKTYVKQPS